MNDEKLIMLVQQQPALYDKSNWAYKDMQGKKEVWRDIAEELGGVSGDFCQKKWQAIRDKYGRELRQTRGASGSGATAPSTWALFESLQFLSGHMMAKRQRSNFSILCNSQEHTRSMPSFQLSPLPSPTVASLPTTPLESSVSWLQAMSPPSFPPASPPYFPPEHLPSLPPTLPPSLLPTLPPSSLPPTLPPSSQPTLPPTSQPTLPPTQRTASQRTQRKRKAQEDVAFTEFTQTMTEYLKSTPAPQPTVVTQAHAFAVFMETSLEKLSAEKQCEAISAMTVYMMDMLRE